jgi:hypothetical protein
MEREEFTPSRLMVIASGRRLMQEVNSRCAEKYPLDFIEVFLVSHQNFAGKGKKP